MSDYAELGLQHGASADQVKAAFRRLSMEWHPDRNQSPGALARFQRISAAYTKLTKGGSSASNGTGANTSSSIRQRVFVVEIGLGHIITGFTFTGSDSAGRTLGRWAIPAGTRHDQMIRLDAKYELKILVRNDSEFKIEGQNIIWRTTIKKSQNRKDFKVKIKLPEGGEKTSELPRAVGKDEFLRIHNYGVPNFGSKFQPFYNTLNQRGELHVHFDIIDDTPWIVKKAKNIFARMG